MDSPRAQTGCYTLAWSPPSGWRNLGDHCRNISTAELSPLARKSRPQLSKPAGALHCTDSPALHTTVYADLPSTQLAWLPDGNYRIPHAWLGHTIVSAEDSQVLIDTRITTDKSTVPVHDENDCFYIVHFKCQTFRQDWRHQVNEHLRCLSSSFFSEVALFLGRR